MLIVVLHHKHVRYAVHEQQHEAGYDAYLTAQVFLALAAEMVECGKDLEDQTYHVLSNGIFFNVSYLPKPIIERKGLV